MVQFGPRDFSVSLGVPGRSSHPKVKEAELRVIKTAIEMGIRPRVELGFDFSLEEVRRYMDLGVRDFNLPMEVEVLYPWWRKHGDSLRNVLERV